MASAATDVLRGRRGGSYRILRRIAVGGICVVFEAEGPGEGPRARSIRSDQLEPRREESKRLGGLLEHLTGEKATLQKQSREAEAAAITQFETKLTEIAKANQAEADRVAAGAQRPRSAIPFPSVLLESGGSIAAVEGHPLARGEVGD